MAGPLRLAFALRRRQELLFFLASPLFFCTLTTTHVGTALPRGRTRRTSRFLFAAGLSFGSTVGALLSRVDWRVGIAGCLGFLTRGCTGFAADLPLFVGFNDSEAFASPSSASNARLRAMVASRSSSLSCGYELSCPLWRLARGAY